MLSAFCHQPIPVAVVVFCGRYSARTDLAIVVVVVGFKPSVAAILPMQTFIVVVAVVGFKPSVAAILPVQTFIVVVVVVVGFKSSIH